MRAVTPFRLSYTLTRRQRLDELFPWLPAAAGSLGFGLGMAYLAVFVSPVFLVFLALPVLLYRGLFALLIDLALRPRQPVEVTVGESQLSVTTDGRRHALPLAGIIQVFRTEGAWTLLHRDGTSLLIPMDAVTEPQIDYLKQFALRALAERKAAAQRS